MSCFALVWVFAILKNKKVWLLFHCKSSIVILSIHICTLFYFKIKKNKKERQGKKLILRKMIQAGLELTTPNSSGQCSNHCAKERFKIERVFVLFKDNQYLHTDKTVSMQSELLAFPANIVNTQGVPIGVKASTARTS